MKGKTQHFLAPGELLQWTCSCHLVFYVFLFRAQKTEIILDELEQERLVKCQGIASKQSIAHRKTEDLVRLVVPYISRLGTIYTDYTLHFGKETLRKHEAYKRDLSI